jgi:dihydroorotate dehydrogenase electron transfer subunit
VGNTFAVSDKKALIVGGGIGIYPLLELAKRIKPKAVAFGFKSKDFVTLEDEFSRYTGNLYISTDDGSYKIHGNALSPVSEGLEKGEFEVAYACGPLPMLKALKAITDRINVECQISLEERMGCGIGACLCCAVRVEDDGDLGYKHLHICKNGPIFNAKEVIL